MTFYFYYLCVGIIWQELAEEGRRRKKSREICCINCGSNMVIECGGPAARGAAVGGEGGEEEEEGISLGIPVCEALDLEAIQQEGSSQATDICRPAARSSAAVSEQVDQTFIFY